MLRQKEEQNHKIWGEKARERDEREKIECQNMGLCNVFKLGK